MIFLSVSLKKYIIIKVENLRTSNSDGWKNTLTWPTQRQLLITHKGTQLSVLRTLDEEKKSNWSDYVSKDVQAYNCTTSEATGYSLFYLLSGRRPPLPIDLIFGINEEEGFNSHQEYAQKLQRQMAEANNTASKTIKNITMRGKTSYDKKVWCFPQEYVSVRGTKLQSYWEDQVHIVVSRKGEDSPVYEVQ